MECDFLRDENRILYFVSHKYIEKMVDSYYNMFEHKPKLVYISPLEKGDYPELDTSKHLDEDGVQIYQSIVRSVQ